MYRHIRAVILALACALLPGTIGVAASAASQPTTTVTRVLDDSAVPDSICQQLFHHQSGCHTRSTVTGTVANNPAILGALGVKPAAAFSACTNVMDFQQGIYLGSVRIAVDNFEFAYCWTSNAVQVTWGPQCWANSYFPYGNGQNFCYGPNWLDGNLPGVAQNSWYLFGYATPWQHVNGMQQVLLYPGWWTYSRCWIC